MAKMPVLLDEECRKFTAQQKIKKSIAGELRTVYDAVLTEIDIAGKKCRHKKRGERPYYRFVLSQTVGYFPWVVVGR